jgi:preprotein translocase subunit SecE
MVSERTKDNADASEDESVSATPDDVPTDLAALEKQVAARQVAEGEEQEGGISDALAPSEMGFQRFVYAAFFGMGIAVAFLATKIVHAAWTKLAMTRPDLGEPRDELVYPISAVIGLAVTLFYFKRQSSRQYAEEVASELSKVSWPGKREVGNSTFVVVATTIAATIFFAVLDGFWRWATDKFYGL